VRRLLDDLRETVAVLWDYEITRWLLRRDALSSAVLRRSGLGDPE
jgi:hypothetical protein